ncbi:MAG: sigma-70 family RNA polymerase sigma factor [Bacteroidota bacterium]
MNTQQIVIACKKGKRSAEKKLFLHFAPKILTLCRRYIPDEHRAQDMLQECFLKVFENIKKYDPEKGDFGGWLFRVCTNVVLKSLRHAKKELPIVYLEELPEGEEITESGFDLINEENLLHSIRKLPDGYRTVLNLYVFENWSHREIAQSLNISESASRSQLARAKKMLKIILEKKIGQQHETGLAR